MFTPYLFTFHVYQLNSCCRCYLVSHKNSDKTMQRINCANNDRKTKSHKTTTTTKEKCNDCIIIIMNAKYWNFLLFLLFKMFNLFGLITVNNSFASFFFHPYTVGSMRSVERKKIIEKGSVREYIWLQLQLNWIVRFQLNKQNKKSARIFMVHLLLVCVCVCIPSKVSNHIQHQQYPKIQFDFGCCPIDIERFEIKPSIWCVLIQRKD